MKLQYKILIQTVVFDSIEIEGGNENFTFKLEIYQKANGKFCGQLLRREMYNFECTFADCSPSESIFVLDYHSLPELDEREFITAEACFQYVHQMLEKMFFQKYENKG